MGAALAASSEIVLPVFALIVLGYLLTKTPVLRGDAAVRALTGFVMYTAIPALLFRLYAGGLSDQGFDTSFVLAYFGPALLVYGVTMLVGRFVFGHKGPELGLMGMSTTFSNTVLLGLPLIIMAFGEEGVIPLTMIVAFHSIILIPMTTLIIEASRVEGKGQGAVKIILSALKSLLVHPVVMAMVAGLAFGATGLEIAPVADRFISLLGSAATPTALVALGGSLAQFRVAGDLKESLFLVLGKLVILPLFVWAALTFVFDVPPLWVAVATINASMPAGINVFILSTYYDVYTRRAASAILIGTGLSVFVSAFLIAAFTTDMLK